MLAQASSSWPLDLTKEPSVSLLPTTRLTLPLPRLGMSWSTSMDTGARTQDRTVSSTQTEM